MGQNWLTTKGTDAKSCVFFIPLYRGVAGFLKEEQVYQECRLIVGNKLDKNLTRSSVDSFAYSKIVTLAWCRPWLPPSDKDRVQLKHELSQSFPVWENQRSTYNTCVKGCLFIAIAKFYLWKNWLGYQGVDTILHPKNG